MKLKEDNIDIYNDSAIILNNTSLSIVKSWIIILIILSLLFISISFIPFNIYKTYSSYVIIKNNESYLSLTVNKNDFPINKKDILYIKNNKYKYKIMTIEDNNIILKVNLKEDIKINNNIVIVNILKDRTSIFKILKNKIKKGFDL